MNQLGQTKDDIIKKLVEARKSRKISVPKLSELLGIPKDRIYKWEQSNSSPKWDDREKLEAWLQDGNWKNVPHENKPGSGLTDHEKYVALLESTNRTLEKSIQLSLNAILENQLLIKARLNTNSDNIQDLLVDNGRKLDDVRDETNRRMAAHLDALMKTGRS